MREGGGGAACARWFSDPALHLTSASRRVSCTFTCTEAPKPQLMLQWKRRDEVALNRRDISHPERSVEQKPDVSLQVAWTFDPGGA